MWKELSAKHINTIEKVVENHRPKKKKNERKLRALGILYGSMFQQLFVNVDCIEPKVTVFKVKMVSVSE